MPALAHGRFNVFISSSPKETEIALVIQEALRSILGNTVDVFVGGGIERFGSSWREVVQKNLVQADLFLLILTDASSFSYSALEAGIFKASQTSPEKRTVVICADNIAVPAVLSEMLNVHANSLEIEEFLIDLWERERSSVVAADAHKHERVKSLIRECSLKISEAFEQAFTRETSIEGYKPDELQLRFTLPSSSTVELPTGAVISSSRMEIFGLQKKAPNGKEWTWGAYLNHAKADVANPGWLTELEAACIDFANGKLGTFKRTYKSTHTGKTYLPMLYRALLAEGKGEGRNYTVTIHLIETSNVETIAPRIDDKLIFVIAAFNDESEVIYEGIAAAADSLGLIAKRVKDEVGDYRITDQLLAMIENSRFVVCDLSFERPNVYFELGYTRGIGKKVITIARKGTVLHFDVKDWTCLFYTDSRELERALRARLQREMLIDFSPPAGSQK